MDVGQRAASIALEQVGVPYRFGGSGPGGFDFNFFNSDRIVCTEVIYRAYDGLEGLEFPLRERAGRKTLSAEDLLDFAMDTGAFTPVAIFGVEGCKDSILYGAGVADALLTSYRQSP